jgi:hypothetical protein
MFTMMLVAQKKYRISLSVYPTAAPLQHSLYGHGFGARLQGLVMRFATKELAYRFLGKSTSYPLATAR